MLDVNIIKIDIEGGEQYIEKGLDYISGFCDIKILLSIHTPFWTNKEKTTDMLLKQFKKFDVFTDLKQKAGEDELKQMMLSEQPTSYEGKTGNFFTLILKTKGI
jgi:hypothetical protein